jgi:hypothetical protein
VVTLALGAQTQAWALANFVQRLLFLNRRQGTGPPSNRSADRLAGQVECLIERMEFLAWSIKALQAQSTAPNPPVLPAWTSSWDGGNAAGAQPNYGSQAAPAWNGGYAMNGDYAAGGQQGYTAGGHQGQGTRYAAGRDNVRPPPQDGTAVPVHSPAFEQAVWSNYHTAFARNATPHDPPTPLFPWQGIAPRVSTARAL